MDGHVDKVKMFVKKKREMYLYKRRQTEKEIKKNDRD